MWDGGLIIFIVLNVVTILIVLWIIAILSSKLRELKTDIITVNTEAKMMEEEIRLLTEEMKKRQTK